MKSSSLEYSSFTSVKIIHLSCALSTQNFLVDLSHLPADIANPSTTSSWSEYKWFLNKYGSYIVSKVYLGARLEHFATTESSSSYDESDFKARLCLDVEGLTPGKVFTVNGCNSFSKERREEAEEYIT